MDAVLGTGSAADALGSLFGGKKYPTCFREEVSDVCLSHPLFVRRPIDWGDKNIDRYSQRVTPPIALTLAIIVVRWSSLTEKLCVDVERAV